MAKRNPTPETSVETTRRGERGVATNALKIRLDNLKTFQPLTDNQKKFFDAYKRGDYFVALHGVAGTCLLYTSDAADE